MARFNPTPGRPTARTIAEARARRIAKYEQALQRLPDWPDGMPPTHDVGIGVMVGLERLGLAERCERDRLGDLRFKPTDAALAPDAVEIIRRALA